MSISSAETYRWLKANGAKFTTREIDVDKIAAETMASLRAEPLQTKVGDRVRLCFDAKLPDTVGARPLVDAHLSRPLVVTGVWRHGVRVGDGAWAKSWIRVP